MSNATVTWDDPNTVGSVTSYRVKLKDANGATVIEQTTPAPTAPLNIHRSFTYSIVIPAALPITVEVYAVNNGIASDPAVFVSNTSKPSPVTTVNLTVT